MQFTTSWNKFFGARQSRQRRQLAHSSLRQTPRSLCENSFSPKHFPFLSTAAVFQFRHCIGLTAHKTNPFRRKRVNVRITALSAFNLHNEARRRFKFIFHFDWCHALEENGGFLSVSRVEVSSRHHTTVIFLLQYACNRLRVVGGESTQQRKR